MSARARTTFGVVLSLIPVATGLTTIITRPGETADVTTRDGSQIKIAGDSVVQIDDTDDCGGNVVVEQKRGLASFHAQHIPTRKFEVRTPSADVWVLGTTFEVFHEDHTEVTTLDGVVRVQSGSSFWDFGPTQSANVKRNHQAIIDGNNIIVRPVDAAARLAWERGLIVVDPTPLQTVIAMLNRHLRTPIKAPSDPEARRFMIAGTFSIDHPESFSRWLESERNRRKDYKKSHPKPPPSVPKVE